MLGLKVGFRNVCVLMTNNIQHTLMKEISNLRVKLMQNFVEHKKKKIKQFECNALRV